MTSDPHIRILMCTLNGAAYLREQLGSFLVQSHKNWSLWVSDDGSDDATRDILDDFRSAHPGRDIRIFSGPGQGAAANYFSLFARLDPQPDLLVALSDQDDVWLPDKLARAAEAIATRSGRSSSVAIYAATQILADENLAHRRQSRVWPSGPSFSNALVQNILSGNSLVVNHNAVALIVRTLPQGYVPFHDWWIYQVITGADGQVIIDPEPALIYRQHGANTLGSNRGLRAIRRRVAMVWGHKYASWAQANVAELRAVSASLTPENRELLRRFGEGIGQGGTRRVRQLRELGVARQTGAGTLVMLLAAVLGRL